MTTPLKITVHPGLGDLSWLYSKFANLDRPLDLTVCEDATHRSGPFLELLPNVYDYHYSTGQLDYERLKTCWNGTYEEILAAESRGDRIYLSCNNWVDNGRRLEDWLPDLATDFHYEIPLSHDAYIASAHLLPPGAMYIAIHTASLGGMKAWDGWGPGEWLEFIQAIASEYPHIVFVLLGATWDEDMADQLRPLLTQSGITHLNLVGKTDLALTLAVLRRCRYVVGFASGVSILANVLQIPTLMLYPSHLHLLMHAWPDLNSIADGSYVGIVWSRPREAYRKVGLQIQRALS
jgi:glycosyltransferase involved in cell wall biosynthesis